jgi:hypothetical protein
MNIMCRLTNMIYNLFVLYSTLEPEYFSGLVLMCKKIENVFCAEFTSVEYFSKEYIWLHHTNIFNEDYRTVGYSNVLKN